MAKIPRVLIKQIENFEEVIKALNGLIDGTKIKLEYYDEDFLQQLSGIRKKGLDLRDEIQVFKNSLETSLSKEYEGNSRFASDSEEASKSEMTRKVIASFLTKKEEYR